MNNRLQFFHKHLFRRVLLLEWALLGVCVLMESLALATAPPNPTAPDLRVSMLLLAIVWVLSFFLPLRAHYWDRICYLMLELVLLSASAGAGLARFVFPLYMIVIAKACLILDQRGFIIIFVAALVTQLLCGAYKITLDQPQLLNLPIRASAVFTLTIGSIVWTYASITLMVIVALLTRSLVSEQKSRLETERLSEEVETLATELERTRIAREIHDSLGHTLTSLNIQLDVARRLTERDPVQSKEALETAKELATQSLTDVRMAVQSIRNADFNLRSSISSLVKEVSERNALAVDAKISVEDLPSAVSFQLFRVVQECLTNILKHANATKVTIEIENKGNSVELNVVDDGRGLQPEYINVGYGIRGMQERVESMNGSVAIHTGPEHGTRIQVIIPV